MRNVLQTLAFASIAALAPPALAQPSPQAMVEGGTVTGSVSNGVAAFKGIPYAAPPAGDLRWRAPQPVKPWSGVRSATEYGHDCMQVVIPDEAALISTEPAEDCLYVNVWKPVDMPAGGQVPVMVWIHGGGYLNGGSSDLLASGARLAARGIVVVSFNYRLGRLGFFAHPALLAAKEGPVGNFGYMDQIAALRWVQANVAAFGGDPARVTVTGESAGAVSVVHLLMSPAARGLFRAAVVMSGGGRKALGAHPMVGSSEAPGPLSAEVMDSNYAESLAITGKDSAALKALRALSPKQAIGDIALPNMLQSALVKGDTSFPGTPMTDGAIVSAEPEKIFKERRAAPVPMLIGTTALDMPLFLPPRADPFSYFGPDADAAKAAYDPGGTLPPELVLLGISADITMHEPARFAAQSMTAAGNAAWLYRFTYAAESVSERARGAVHAQDVPYIFDNVDARYGAATTPKDREVARQFSTYLVNFVKTGDPNGTGVPSWPKFDPASFNLMDFTLDGTAVFGPDPRKARISLVEKAIGRKR